MKNWNNTVMKEEFDMYVDYDIFTDKKESKGVDVGYLFIFVLFVFIAMYPPLAIPFGLLLMAVR